ncbi:archaeal proteasome endopeptidase complex subunit beta [Candidatus Bathyarchaeota archaeon]|nr:archaeal proteasome endopeptidase complex subunit beta [Candidatus Bathyarchaeota archaeon]
MNEDTLKVLKGTTTMGIVCQDGIVIATDTRVTMGYLVAHKKGKKVFKIDDHLAMTIAGVVADAQNVVNILQANAKLYRLEKDRAFPVKSLSRLASNILYSSRAFPLVMQAIIGGIDDSGPRIYALDPFGSVIEEKMVSTGSGSPVAYGVLEAEYTESLSVQEGIPLVVKAVWSAMKRDIGSGDSFDVATVTKEGYKELSDQDKTKFLEA